MGTTAREFSHNINTRQPNVGNDIRALLLSTVANTQTQTEHGDVTSSTTRTVIPYISNAAPGVSSSSAGWGWNATGGSGMDSVAGARRIVEAGTWEFRQRVTIAAGAGVSGRHRLTLSFQVFRILANGTRVLIGTAVAPEAAGQPIVQSTVDITHSANFPRIVLEEGESLMVSYTAGSFQNSGTLGATTQGIYTYEMGGNFSRVIVPAPGYRTFFEKSQVDAAPASDAPTGRQLLLPRAAQENIATAEALDKVLSLFRSITESFPTATQLERRILFSRALEEITSIESDLARQVFNIRTQSESIPTSEELSAAFTGARTITQSVPTTEQVARQQFLTRRLDESTSVSAALARRVLFSRNQQENAQAVATLQRALVLARDIQRTHPTVDTLERVLIYVRGVAEDLAQGGGDINVIKRMIQVFDD